MKIGLTTFGGDGGKSGISQYIVNLLREFSRMENTPAIEVLTCESERELFMPENKERLTSLVFPDSLRRTSRSLLWHQTSLPGVCRNRKYDILFLPAGNRRLPLAAPCPTVGTIHDFSSLHVAGKYDPSRMFYITRVLPFLARRLSHVITVSESSKRDIVEYARIPEKRVSVISNAVDHAFYYPRPREEAQERIRERYGIECPYLLYLSRIEHPGKNHVRLLRAFDQLKARTRLPHRLVLVGSDWDRADEVHQEAAKLACRDDILFTGFAPTEDIPYFYSGADAMLFPSLYEGFGLPILEAMACGLPVACANVSSLPEVAGNAALLFDPYNEEAITQGMEVILDNAEIRDCCITRGLMRSRQFTWQRAAEQTLTILQNVGCDKHK